MFDSHSRSAGQGTFYDLNQQRIGQLLAGRRIIRQSACYKQSLIEQNARRAAKQCVIRGRCLKYFDQSTLSVCRENQLGFQYFLTSTISQALAYSRHLPRIR